MSFYMPVLKSKATSFSALGDLKKETKAKVVPLFEMVPDTEDKFQKRLLHSWSGQRAFVDFSYVDDEGIGDAVSGVMEACNDSGASVIPVLCIDTSDECRNSIITASGDGEIALRFSIDYMTPARAKGIVDSTFGLIRRNPKVVHVFLDVDDVSDNASALYAVNALLPIVRREGISSFSLIAGAFPDASALGQYRNTIIRFGRKDYLLWKELVETYPELLGSVNFSDYTIRDIELPYEGFSPNQIPTLRYTLEEEFYIHRGVSHRKSPRGMNQFNDECKVLIDSPLFRGRDASEGERIIFEKGSALGSSPGNASTWAQIGMNQHMEFVVSQLSRIGVAL